MVKVTKFEKTEEQSQGFKSWLYGKEQDGSFYLNKRPEKNTWMMHSVECKHHGRGGQVAEHWSSSSNPKVVAHKDYDVPEHYKTLKKWVDEEGLKLEFCKNCKPEG